MVWNTCISVHMYIFSREKLNSVHQRFLWIKKVMLVVKNLSANAGDLRDVSLIPGSGKSPGGGNSNPLQYFCLENPMDRRAWQATVYRVSKSWTWLKQHSRHTHTYAYPQYMYGLLWWLSKKSTCNAGDLGVDLSVGKIPWRRAWQPIPVFLPGESP